MFVYLDETEFGDGKYSGYACLITPSRIQRDVIDEALENLRNDPDRFAAQQKPMDDRTLDRQFFHAADDSKNAHSHLCRAIYNHVKGNFKTHIFHTKKHTFTTKEDLYDLASKLAVIGLFSHAVELTFIFEQRDNLNVGKLLSKWWPDLWFDLARNSYAAPFIVKYYPKVTFEIGTKSEPGLQVVDFMLWASQKARMDPKSKWFEYLPGWSKSKTSTVDGGWEGDSITMLEPRPLSERRYDIEHSNFSDPRFNSVDILWHFIVNVQTVINKSFALSDKSRIMHFFDDIEELYNNRNVIQGPHYIKKMAECFVKLFDNVEVVQLSASSEDKTFWLAARKCMAYVFHESLDAWIHTRRLADIRNELIVQQPSRLSLGID